jgi:hypothetical protein
MRRSSLSRGFSMDLNLLFEQQSIAWHEPKEAIRRLHVNPFNFFFCVCIMRVNLNLARPAFLVNNLGRRVYGTASMNDDISSIFTVAILMQTSLPFTLSPSRDLQIFWSSKCTEIFSPNLANLFRLQMLNIFKP